MKFTHAWLKSHLDTTDTLDAIAETLTRVGLEVEGVEDKAKALSAFTIAYVIDAKPHPNADRLRVCMVDTGAGEPVQVVCGAPNARTGMKSVFSPPGTYIPGKDITLGKGVIRGVESNGMLCSAAELQTSDESDGIIDLPDDAPIGQPYASYIGLDDAVIEIAVTPNRADALGTTSPRRFYPGAHHAKQWYMPETQRQVRPAWAPCSCSVLSSLKGRSQHRRRCGSAVPNNTGCLGLLGLESRQFF